MPNSTHTAQTFNTCTKCGGSVPAPLRAHVENLGGCPEVQSRRTSLYSLRVQNVYHTEQRAILRTVAEVIGADRLLADQHTETGANDSGYVAVGFRAADDAEALRVAASVRPHLPGDRHGPRYPDLTISTGFGIHRREFPAAE